MRLVPEDNVGKVQFFTSRLAPWAEHAVEMGSSAEEVALLQAEVDEARAALQAQRQAQNIAQAATQLANRAIEALARRGANIIQQVRARAATEGNGIYSLAMIPPPNDPSPLGPPGMPSRITAELLPTGPLRLHWKCKNPPGATGTMYQVTRSADGGPFVLLGITGDKKFIDETIPRGASRLVYRLQAVRTTAVGEQVEFPVSFGENGSRLMTFQPIKPRKATLYAA